MIETHEYSHICDRQLYSLEVPIEGLRQPQIQLYYNLMDRYSEKEIEVTETYDSPKA